MLKEFIQSIRDNLLRSECRIIGDPREESVVYVFNPSDGSFGHYTTLPISVSGKVRTLDDIWTFLFNVKCPLYRRHEVDADADAIAETFDHTGPSIWIGDSSVLAFVDTNRREPVCRMEIELHHAVFKLEQLRIGSWHSHAEFLNLIRNDLYGVSFSPKGFVESIQSLKFESSQNTESQISGIGDHSISKSAMAKATGAAQIPEEITVSFNPLPGLKEVSLVSNVKCAVSIDSVRATMRLMPRPGELNQARLEIRNAIKLALMDCENSDEDVPVLFGEVAGV